MRGQRGQRGVDGLHVVGDDLQKIVSHASEPDFRSGCGILHQRGISDFLLRGAGDALPGGCVDIEIDVDGHVPVDGQLYVLIDFAFDVLIGVVFPVAGAVDFDPAVCGLLPAHRLVVDHGQLAEMGQHGADIRMGLQPECERDFNDGSGLRQHGQAAIRRGAGEGHGDVSHQRHPVVDGEIRLEVTGSKAIKSFNA